MGVDFEFLYPEFDYLALFGERVLVAVDSEVLPVRPAIYFSSLFVNSRSVGPHRVHEIEVEKEDDAPVSMEECVKELSTWVADIAVRHDVMYAEMVVHHDDMRTKMERYFDVMHAETQ